MNSKIGKRVVVLDGHAMTSRDEAHEYLKLRLNFPEYYGKNLDALNDCIGAIRTDTCIVLYRFDEMRNCLGEYGNTMEKIIRESCDVNPHIQVLADSE